MPTTSAFSCKRWRTRARRRIDSLDAVGRQERVAEDLLGLLADAVDAAGSLDEPDDGPGQVVVDDDRAVLEVLAFAEDVGGDQDAQFLVRRDLVALVVADRAEAPGELGRVRRVAGDASDALDTPRAFSCALEVANGVGELGEDEDLLVRVFLGRGA